MSFIIKYNGNINVIGSLLKKYRLENKLSYEQLSTKLQLKGINIHKQSLYDIENNKRTVKDYELFALAYILKIDVNDLLEDIRKNSNVKEVCYDNHNLVITYYKGKNNLAEFTHYLEGKKIHYNRIFSERPTLNDVFLELTGKGLRD